MALDPPPPRTPVPTMPSPRLDPPSLPANPTQLERGSYAFWLNCLPCHGDQGQGLTDEFRRLYPPDHQNCWASGCHGERPYEGGWVLPRRVPPLIGGGALAGFPDATALYAFVQASMPFEAPGSLDADTYWDIVAYLAEKNGDLPDRQVLGPDTAAGIQIAGSAAPIVVTPATAPVPAHPSPERTASAPAIFWGLVLFGLMLGGAFLARDLRRR
jgi:cytochrome c